MSTDAKGKLFRTRTLPKYRVLVNQSKIFYIRDTLKIQSSKWGSTPVDKIWLSKFKLSGKKGKIDAKH